MKEYEIVREIFNACSGNQMRDVFIEEVSIEDAETYVREKCKGKNVELETNHLEDGSIVIDVVIADLKQRFTFTQI